jgi:MFS family permease
VSSSHTFNHNYCSAGYLLRHQDHRTVIGFAVAINNFFTLLWALTPVDTYYSVHLFIGLRFIMGLTQCVVCVFLPLWTNQFAPKDKKTSWMGYLQVDNYSLQVLHNFFLGMCRTSFVAAFQERGRERYLT